MSSFASVPLLFFVHRLLVLLIPSLLFLPASIFGNGVTSLPCAARHYPDGIVCVCNATYCDGFTIPATISQSQAMVYTSTLAGKRFVQTTLDLVPFTDDKSAAEFNDFNKFDAQIEVQPMVRRQTLFGFGGAFTDAVGINLRSLSKHTRKRLLTAYFGDSGIRYTMGRVPIASCDFSTRVYSYCDVEGDFELKNFSLVKEDIHMKIPFIKHANRLTGGQLRLFASPWSAPGWMKETGRMKGGGPLKGPRNGVYYVSWARYFLRFFEEYRKWGVPFWGLTLQNEPSSSGWFKWYDFQAMYLNAKMQRDFARDLLGPLLHNHSAAIGQLKVIINDDNRFFLPSSPDLIFADTQASKFIDGVAVHWYWNRLFSVQRLQQTHDRHPDKFILPSEACNGWWWWPIVGHKGVMLGDWARGEAYARDIIENLEHWAVGWIDWNLCLNEGGGPTWMGNWVDAPVIVNGTADEFYKQPMFYAIGHFSKFIPPNSVHIQSTLITNIVSSKGRHRRDRQSLNGLTATAALDPVHNRLALVVQNRHETKAQRLRIVVVPDEKENGEGEGEDHELELTVEPNSLTTVLIPKQQ